MAEPEEREERIGLHSLSPAPGSRRPRKRVGRGEGSGTGKTASYLLPTLTRLMEGPRRLRALVLAPTRELCVLVEAAARAFGRFTHVRATAVFGGVPLAGQERFVREEGTELLIATPARLLELHGRQAINLWMITSSTEMTCSTARDSATSWYSMEVIRTSIWSPRPRTTSRWAHPPAPKCS